jgi:hypothetical protein
MLFLSLSALKGFAFKGLRAFKNMVLKKIFGPYVGGSDKIVEKTVE